MKQVNIVYSARGWLGIENQTRYNTEDILAIVNWIESRVTGEPRRPIGSVLQIVSWRHSNPFRSDRGWTPEGTWETKLIPNWVLMHPRHAWNVVKVVPPDRLYLNPLEALADDNPEAPMELVKQVALRLARELGAYFDLPKDMSGLRLRVSAERGSRVRAVNTRVERVGIATERLNRAELHLRRCRWRAYTCDDRLAKAAADFDKIDANLSLEVRATAEEIQRVIKTLNMLDVKLGHLRKNAHTINLTKDN